MSESVRESAKKPEAAKEDRTSQTRTSDYSQPVNSSIDRILFLQRTIGNQAVGRLIKSGALQAKLKKEQPDNIYEQEVDRVTEQVMRMPDVSGQTKNIIIQRKCPKCLNGLHGLLRKDKKDEKLQAKGDASQTSEVAPQIEANINALRSGGQPLPESVLSFFEPRFGHDFSQVRVHSGADAGQSARDVDSKAYTVGHDIVFGAGQFAAGTQEGRQLIAPELTHTIQQGKIPTATSGCADPVGRPQLGISNVAWPLSGLVQRSWTSDRINWVRTATHRDNWSGSDPPGAYYVLNGLSIDDMVDVLRALAPADLKKLSDNLSEKAKGFDIPRLHLGIAIAATPSTDKEFRKRSEDLHWAIWIDNYSNPPDDAYFQLAAVDSTKRQRLLNALSPSPRKKLFDHLNEASSVPGGEEVISSFGRPDYSVTATTIKGPEYGHCREVNWTVRWGTQPTLKNGFIVQEIRRINTDYVSATGTIHMPNTDTTYWEAWPIDENGDIGDSGQDIWENGARPWSKGKWEIIGRAFAISRSLDTKARFSRGKIENAKLLRSTDIRPDNLGPPSLKRAMNGEWDCTDDNAKPDGFRYHRPFKPKSL